MAQKIGTQHGATAAANRWRNLDPGGTKLTKTADGKWPSINTLTIPQDQWGAYDKLEKALTITFADHDAEIGGGGQPVPPPTSDTSDAKARIFLAHEVLNKRTGERRRVELDPLAALQAPPWMVPVCTADPGYRQFYPPSTIQALRNYFGHVEAWCDCRPSGGTPYSEAVAMTEELGLDAPAWGQCETQPEFDHAYESGARRLVGKISNEVCDSEVRLPKVASGEVHLSVELYCNCMPWVTPDWRDANAGVGGNCIACYSDATPCNYTPVQWYKDRGWYVPHHDSVYAVGLTSADWAALW